MIVEAGRRWRNVGPQLLPQLWLVNEAQHGGNQVVNVTRSRRDTCAASTLRQRAKITGDARQAELEAFVEHQTERLDARTWKDANVRIHSMQLRGIKRTVERDLQTIRKCAQFGFERFAFETAQHAQL